jgi:hypothetical protein
MGLHPVVKQGSRAFGAAKLQTCGNPLVHVIQKDTFLPSSTVHDVIHRSRILYAQRPRHAATVPNPITTSSALIQRGQPDSAEEPQLAKNQHQERPSKHPRQKSKSFVRHLRAIFFGLFSRKQMVFPKTGGCSAESEDGRWKMES